MSLQLLPFQQTGAHWLASRRRALLADEMRVGKSPQAVAACDLVGARTVLTVCPAIARPGWLREFRRFSRRPGVAIESAATAPRGLTVVSYDHLADPVVYALLARNWDAVILDEGHFAKDYGAARTQAAFGLANGACYAWALTGTPMPNHRGELWPLLHGFGLLPAAVGGTEPMGYWQFTRRYCVVRNTPYGDKVVGNREEHDAEFNALLARVMLRRTLGEVAPEMPVAQWHPFAIEAGPIALPARERQELIALAAAEELALLDRLNAGQAELDGLDPDAAPHYRRLLGLQKVQPVAEQIRSELDNGMRRIVVFGWHTDVLEALRLALRKYGARVIYGATSDSERIAVQQAFADDASDCRVALCNIKTAGTAIDLSAADDALFIEEDWVPANNLQAAYRIVSQFKRRPTRIRTALLAGSTDERVTAVNHSKIKMIQSTFTSTVVFHTTL